MKGVALHCGRRKRRIHLYCGQPKFSMHAWVEYACDMYAIPNYDYLYNSIHPEAQGAHIQQLRK